ncbi:hypothetical protein [Streptomyces rimosus]|uniref:hypothetical protein n=1 Tax=Streptomyces rimosus TaxID=1927 RepID=UPI00067C1A8C|nr:hypothetical protein [Streptomyces rimosus]
MADDRYDWLDEEAAERLLRGEPAGSPDGVGAAELTALLNAAASAGRSTAPDEALPGEEAALAAFRQARAAASAAPGSSAATPELGTVRAPRGAGPAARPRFGRPLRRGFMVALAGCALGGVAVAAGVGVLPTPFHGGSGPGPATSVSAAETPGPLASDGTETTTGGTSPVPDVAPTDRPGPSATGTGDGGGTGGTQSPAPGQTGQSTPGQDATGGTDDGGRPGDDRDHKPDAKEKHRLGTSFCRTYLSRQGSGLGQDTLRRLERAAGGPDKVYAFCRQFLSHGKDDKYEGGRYDGDGKGGHGRGDHGQGGHGQGHGKGGRGDGEDDDRHGRGPSFGLPAPGTHRTVTDPATVTPGAPDELRIPGAPRIARV